MRDTCKLILNLAIKKRLEKGEVITTRLWEDAGIWKMFWLVQAFGGRDKEGRV